MVISKENAEIIKKQLLEQLKNIPNENKDKLIEYIKNKSNQKNLESEINKFMKVNEEIFLDIIVNESFNTEYKIELLVISKILCMNINVYDEYQNFKFGFSDGKYLEKENKDAINLQYFYYGNKYPSTISCIYNI